MIVFGSSPAEAAAVLAHPHVIIASDGLALGIDHRENLSHPRSIGTFPRALSSLVDAGVPLHVAIHKATGMPAKQLQLRDRGTITSDSKADIVAFCAPELADNADFITPLIPPAGIIHVIINGQLVVHAGDVTGALPGRLLSPWT